MKKAFSLVLSFGFLGILGWGIYWIFGHFWDQFRLLDPKVSIAILSASTTVIVATFTVVAGKYFERKKDIEAHFREKKIKIYDEFLCEFFKVFYSDNNNGSDDENIELVEFLQEWQRKIILWGGQDVLLKYIDWMKHLKSGHSSIQAMFMMEEFFLVIRKDLGHKNNKLVKGTFLRLLLKNPEFILEMANENPNLSLDELAKKEKDLYDQQNPEHLGSNT
jgi:hypothetical protein